MGDIITLELEHKIGRINRRVLRELAGVGTILLGHYSGLLFRRPHRLKEPASIVSTFAYGPHFQT